MKLEFYYFEYRLLFLAEQYDKLLVLAEVDLYCNPDVNIDVFNQVYIEGLHYTPQKLIKHILCVIYNV